MEFICIAAAHFVALLSPGPDFFLILQTAVRMEMKYGWAVCAGIATANAIYLGIAVVGIELVREMSTLMALLRYLGSGYLIYIGFLLLKAPRRNIQAPTTSSLLHRKSLWHQYSLGFASALLNPKNAVFYLSLFTAMVSPNTPLFIRALYGVWMTMIVLLWDMGVVLLVGNRQMKQQLNRCFFAIEKLSGGMLSLFGVLFFLEGITGS